MTLLVKLVTERQSSWTRYPPLENSWSFLSFFSLCPSRNERQTSATSWSGSRATTTTRTAPGSTPTCTWRWSGLASTSLEAKLDRVKRPFCFSQCLPNANMGRWGWGRGWEIMKMWRQWRQSGSQSLPKIAVMLFRLIHPGILSFIALFSFTFHQRRTFAPGCLPAQARIYCRPPERHRSAARRSQVRR